VESLGSVTMDIGVGGSNAAGEVGLRRRGKMA
jgi:hypothetical protein